MSLHHREKTSAAVTEDDTAPFPPWIALLSANKVSSHHMIFRCGRGPPLLKGSLTSSIRPPLITASWLPLTLIARSLMNTDTLKLSHLPLFAGSVELAIVDHGDDPLTNPCGRPPILT
jgi:hypothetical protein